MNARRSTSLLTLVLLLLLTVALVNLVYNLERTVLLPGPALPGGHLGLAIDSGLILFVGMGIAVAGGALSILALLWARTQLRGFPWAALAPFVAVALSLLVIGLLVIPTGDEGPPAEDETGEPGDESPAEGAEAPLEFLQSFIPLTRSTLALTLVMVALATAYFLLVLVRGRRASGMQVLLNRGEDEASRREFVETMERGIYRLELGEDVRSVVLQAYREMVEAFHARGVEAGHHLTAREVESLVRRRLDLTGEAGVALRELFEEARYSLHPLGDDQREAALASLRQVRSELGV